ncbi:MAG: AIR carboxylase family protein [Bacteroidales bacterium]
MNKVVVIMGSKADLEWSKKIIHALQKFNIDAVCRIASAHKVPLQCYDIIKEQEKKNVVFITVAGRSNALSGFTDAQTYCPVIACPPVGDSFGGSDLFSSLRMPSGVAPMVILDPGNAALAAAKILALSDEKVMEKVKAYQEEQRQKLIEDNNVLAGYCE